MSTTLTEAAAWRSTVTVPSDGDPAAVAGLYGASGVGLQALADRSQYLLARVHGSLRGGHLGATTTVLSVNPCNLAMGTEVVDAAVQLHTVGSGILGSLVTNTWYYVYGYISGAALAVEIATAAAGPPDDTLTWRSGGTTRRFLGCFRTYTLGGNTRIVPFTQQGGGIYRYRKHLLADEVEIDLGAYSNAFGAPGTASGTVSSTPRVPPHASLAYLGVQVSSSTADLFSVNVCNNGGASGAGLPMRFSGLNETMVTLDVETSGTLKVELVASTGTPNIEARLYALGFYERDTRG